MGVYQNCMLVLYKDEIRWNKIKYGGSSNSTATVRRYNKQKCEDVIKITHPGYLHSVYRQTIKIKVSRLVFNIFQLRWMGKVHPRHQ